MSLSYYACKTNIHTVSTMKQINAEIYIYKIGKDTKHLCLFDCLRICIISKPVTKIEGLTVSILYEQN